MSFSSLTKKNNFYILGIVIILIYYLLNLFPNLTQSNSSLYLSLSILTDNSYLNLLLSDKSPVFQQGLSFFALPFFIDRLFIKIFGIEYFWLLMILYKIICFLILFKGFEKLFNFNYKNLFFFTICLACFFCIDIAPFADRYPRPQFTNIFVFVIILSNFYFLEQNRGSKSFYVFYGMSQAIVAFTVPWMSAIILFLSISAFLYKTDSILKKYIIGGFSIIFFPSIFIFLVNTAHSSHSEYLGLKEIYSKTSFLYDFYISILLSKQFLLLLFFQACACLITKKLFTIKILFGSLVCAPLIFIFLGKSIQAYHLIEIFKEYQIILCIWVFFKMLYYLQENKLFLSNLDSYFGISAIIVSLILIFNLGSSWIDRAKETEQLWNKNKKIFSYLSSESPECTLVTNDKDIYFYWMNFKKGNVIPNDGFLSTIPIDETIDDIKLSLALLSKIEKPKKSDFNQLLKIATHNYYVSTRSTIAKSIKFENDVSRNKYIKSRKGVNSMQAWRFVPNEMVYKKLADYESLILSEEVQKNKIVIYNSRQNGNLLKIDDNCIN